jgi:hypothetical protein
MGLGKRANQVISYVPSICFIMSFTSGYSY